ncbi:MAG: helix-turn-helix domain-containing protein [Candidatus Uhrbacteria bacterium]|nr:helix-turn-helix domain-containing protein [Patescibacteria group bacterium]MBU1906625.1 helix-turn-helix domain-containing protein [Patescibacteria group bacterium]
MQDFYSVSELAELLGISRIAVNKKITNGQIKAERIGRAFMIPKSEVEVLIGTAISEHDKKIVEQAVKKTVREYGRTLELLSAE